MCIHFIPDQVWSKVSAKAYRQSRTEELQHIFRPHRKRFTTAQRRLVDALIKRIPYMELTITQYPAKQLKPPTTTLTIHYFDANNQIALTLTTIT